MTAGKSDEEIVARVAAQMDAGLESIDGATAGRLQRSRMNALDQLESRKCWFQMPRTWMSPALASSLAIAVLAVSVWFAMPKSGHNSVPLDDLEVVSSPEHLDLINDLEFLQWLKDTNSGRLIRIEHQ
ncbi:MAG: hypothetical protein PVSMB11_04320 [Desulfuromonadaceae bacterium]